MMMMMMILSYFAFFTAISKFITENAGFSVSNGMAHYCICIIGGLLEGNVCKESDVCKPACAFPSLN